MLVIDMMDTSICMIMYHIYYITTYFLENLQGDQLHCSTLPTWCDLLPPINDALSRAASES